MPAGRLPVLSRTRSRIPIHVAVALGVLSLVAGVASVTVAQPTAAAYSIWPDNVAPVVAADSESTSVELGTRFVSRQRGSVTGIRFYKSWANRGPHVGSLWSPEGRKLASVLFASSLRSGWQSGKLDRAVQIDPGKTYTVSYRAPHGRYADDQWVFGGGKTVRTRDLTALSGVYTYGNGMPRQSWNGSNYYVDVIFRPAAASTQDTSPTTPSQPTATTTSSSTPTTQSPTPTVKPTPTETSQSPTPTKPTATETSQSPTPTAEPTTPTATPKPTATTTPTVPTAGGQWPNASNTGVPSGVSLTSYGGPMKITQDGAVIDAKEIRGTIVIAASDVTIKRSKIMGRIDADQGGASVTVVESEIDAGREQAPGVGFSNVTVLRSNIHGGQHSVLCGDNCRVESSWLHDQYLPSNDDWHTNAYLSNGGSNVVLVGNTLQCTPPDNGVTGGCTADASFFGDFEPIKNVTIDGNLFKSTPGGYCGTFGYNRSKPYGTQASGITVVNNVFEHGSGGKCGYWGPVTGFPSGSGNSWANNRWVDGGSIAPSTG